MEVMDDRSCPQVRGLRALHHAICNGHIVRIWQSRATICALAVDEVTLFAFDLVPVSTKSLSEVELITLERIISGEAPEVASAPSEVLSVKLPAKPVNIFCSKGMSARLSKKLPSYAYEFDDRIFESPSLCL